MPASTGEIIDGLWRFEAIHPEWTADEGDGEDGWEPEVAWWAYWRRLVGRRMSGRAPFGLARSEGRF